VRRNEELRLTENIRVIQKLIADFPAARDPIKFFVEFGTYALTCQNQLGIVEVGSERSSNVIANLHIGIPTKPGDAVLLDVIKRVIDRSKACFGFFPTSLAFTDL
jgi:hypothetical protein